MTSDSATLPAGLSPGLLERFIKLNRRSIALYSVISVDPPIFYVPRFASKIDEFTDSFRILFDHLRDRRSIFLFVHYSAVSADDAKAVAELEEQHRKMYERFRFIHLCNDTSQLDLLGGLGCEAYFCNQNALVDERIYRPLDGVEKQFDAVYDARLMPFKRHYLAERIESLGLIYYSVATEDDTVYMQQVKQALAHARFFNHDFGAYRRLSPPEVNRALNNCRVGLCLSAEEGAMYASVQYLLAGLPVVTTPNRGGRNLFLDDDVAVTVEPTPEAVESGVREIIGRDLDPEHIRRKTLEKIRVHRDVFIGLVRDIYRQEGVDRDFAAEWDTIYFDKMVSNRKHVDTIRMLQKPN